MAEYLINGGLDNWTGGIPDGWTKFETPASSIGQGGGAQSGSNCANCFVDFGGRLAYIQQLIAYEIGNEYTITIWLWGDDQPAHTVFVQDYTVAGGGLYETIVPQAAWTKHTFDWTANANSDCIRIGNASGILWSYKMDTISITDRIYPMIVEGVLRSKPVSSYRVSNKSDILKAEKKTN